MSEECPLLDGILSSEDEITTEDICRVIASIKPRASLRNLDGVRWGLRRVRWVDEFEIWNITVYVSRPAEAVEFWGRARREQPARRSCVCTFLYKTSNMESPKLIVMWPSMKTFGHSDAGKVQRRCERLTCQRSFLILVISVLRRVTKRSPTVYSPMVWRALGKKKNSGPWRTTERRKRPRVTMNRATRQSMSCFCSPVPHKRQSPSLPSIRGRADTYIGMISHGDMCETSRLVLFRLHRHVKIQTVHLFVFVLLVIF